MTIFVDAHLPPSLAPWLKQNFGIESFSFDFMGWNFSEDFEIFMKVKDTQESVILTKDEDFVNILLSHKAPPKIIWVTVGNTSNQNLRATFLKQFKEALDLLRDNDLVEITE